MDPTGRRHWKISTSWAPSWDGTGRGERTGRGRRPPGWERVRVGVGRGLEGGREGWRDEGMQERMQEGMDTQGRWMDVEGPWKEGREDG